MRKDPAKAGASNFPSPICFPIPSLPWHWEHNSANTNSPLSKIPFCSLLNSGPLNGPLFRGLGGAIICSPINFTPDDLFEAKVVLIAVSCSGTFKNFCVKIACITTSLSVSFRALLYTSAKPFSPALYSVSDAFKA